MGLLTEASGNQYLFLLSSGQLFQIFLKLPPLKIKLPQNRQKQTFIDSAVLYKLLQAALQETGILGHRRNHQTGANGKSPCIFQHICRFL